MFCFYIVHIFLLNVACFCFIQEAEEDLEMDDDEEDDEVNA